MPHKVQELAMMGLGRCFKVTLQKRAPENFRSRRGGAEREWRVSRHGSEDPHRRERNCIIFFPEKVEAGKLIL